MARRRRTRVVYVERRRRYDDYMGNSMGFMGNMLTLGFGAAILGSVLKN